MAPGYPSQAPPLKIQHHPIVGRQFSITRTSSGRNNIFICRDFRFGTVFRWKIGYGPDPVVRDNKNYIFTSLLLSICLCWFPVGWVWPCFNGSFTFWVALLVFPSELTATCVWLSLAGVVSAPCFFALSGLNLKKSSLPAP